MLKDVPLCQINVKTVKPIGPKYCVGHEVRFMDAQIYKNWYPKVFDFCKILNIRKLFCFYFYWKICSQTEALLKVEIENGRKAP